MVDGSELETLVYKFIISFIVAIYFLHSKPKPPFTFVVTFCDFQYMLTIAYNFLVGSTLLATSY